MRILRKIKVPIRLPAVQQLRIVRLSQLVGRRHVDSQDEVGLKLTAQILSWYEYVN